MEYLLLAVATLLASGKAILSKKIGTGESSVRRVLLTNSAIFITAALPVLIAALIKRGGELHVSLFSVILALVFSAVMVTTQITQMEALSRGSTSITTLIYSAGFLVPTFYGRFALGEHISLVQYIGIAVLFAALYMIVNPGREGKLSVVWLVLAVLSMLGSGTNAVIQKIHQSSDFADELYEFLLLMFIFSAVICIALHFLFPKVEEGSKTGGKNRVLFPISCGMCIGLLNIVNLTLAGKLPAVVQFPVYNIGSMILTGALGIILFKEKNTKKQLIGFAVGCISILMIGLC